MFVLNRSTLFPQVSAQNETSHVLLNQQSRLDPLQDLELNPQTLNTELRDLLLDFEKGHVIVKERLLDLLLQNESKNVQDSRKLSFFINQLTADCEVTTFEEALLEYQKRIKKIRRGKGPAWTEKQIHLSEIATHSRLSERNETLLFQIFLMSTLTESEWNQSFVASYRDTYGWPRVISAFAHNKQYGFHLTGINSNPNYPKSFFNIPNEKIIHLWSGRDWLIRHIFSRR